MNRIDLHKILVELGSENDFKVYFSPPANIQLHYPCLIYTRSNPRTQKADNISYFKFDAYDLVFVTKDPDSIIPDKIVDKLRYATINRAPYVSDGFYHYSIACYNN